MSVVILITVFLPGVLTLIEYFKILIIQDEIDEEYRRWKAGKEIQAGMGNND